MLCHAQIVPKKHSKTDSLFYITHYHPFPLFLFVCFTLWKSIFLFFDASKVCVNNLKMAAVLVF